MAYVKNTWVDREGQTRYHETIDDDGALIFTPDYEKVTEIGTPVNADNMNHIEEGIEDHENRITVLENADGNDFVSKSGDTMTGNLSINKNGGQINMTGTSWKGLTIKSSEIDYTLTNQVSLSNARIIATDKNGQWHGYLQSGVDSNGGLYTTIASRRSISDTAKQSTLSAIVDKNGVAYATAPTPATGDYSTKIATTAYCVNMRCNTMPSNGGASTASATRPAWVIQNYWKDGSWYRVWSDGWIEQGGLVNGGSNSDNVTLLKSYTNANYSVMTSLQHTATEAAYAIIISNMSITGFTLFTYSGGAKNCAKRWYACGY